METLKVNQELKHFTIRGVLGSGGFAVTYLAEDQMLGKLFAIKEYFPESLVYREGTTVLARTASTEDFDWGRRRFLEEARTLAKLDHPNIVGVSQIFEANNTAYMVLEYQKGCSFKAWLEQIGGNPTQEELDLLLAPLLDALSFIHERGILHRDIAPDNLYIRDGGSPVLLDFGAAREALGQRSKSMSAIVKSGYSPYEQYATTGSNQGPWTDIYALAATLYRAVMGKPPPEAAERVLEDSYVPAVRAASGPWRPEFLAAIDWALCVMPKERPQKVNEWRPSLLDVDGRTEGVTHPSVSHAAATADSSPDGVHAKVLAELERGRSHSAAEIQSPKANTGILRTVRNLRFTAIPLPIRGLMLGAISGILSGASPIGRLTANQLGVRYDFDTHLLFHGLEAGLYFASAVTVIFLAGRELPRVWRILSVPIVVLLAWAASVAVFALLFLATSSVVSNLAPSANVVGTLSWSQLVQDAFVIAGAGLTGAVIVYCGTSLLSGGRLNLRAGTRYSLAGATAAESFALGFAPLVYLQSAAVSRSASAIVGLAAGYACWQATIGGLLAKDIQQKWSSKPKVWPLRSGPILKALLATGSSKRRSASSVSLPAAISFGSPPEGSKANTTREPILQPAAAADRLSFVSKLNIKNIDLFHCSIFFAAVSGFLSGASPLGHFPMEPALYFAPVVGFLFLACKRPLRIWRALLVSIATALAWMAARFAAEFVALHLGGTLWSYRAAYASGGLVGALLVYCATHLLDAGRLRVASAARYSVLGAVVGSAFGAHALGDVLGTYGLFICWQVLIAAMLARDLQQNWAVRAKNSKFSSVYLLRFLRRPRLHATKLPGLIGIGLLLIAAAWTITRSIDLTSRDPVPPDDARAMSDKDLCSNALDESRIGWDSMLRWAVEEVARRRLSVDGCRVSLGMPTVAAVLRIQEVRIEANGTAVMNGRGPANSEVTILLGGRSLGSTRTDAAGEWVFSASKPLPAGIHQLTLRMQLQDGAAAFSKQSVSVTVSDRGADDTPSRALNDKEVCVRALNNNRREWDGRPMWREAVAEAARRGLTVDSCRSVLDRPTTTPLGLSNRELCARALNNARLGWDSRPPWKVDAAEAARRKLSVDGCRTALGLPNLIQSLGKYGICNLALASDRTAWNFGHKDAVAEAARRKLSIDDCRAAIGSPKQSTRMDISSKLDVKILCHYALNLYRNEWDNRTEWREYVDETARRTLSVEDCRDALGLSKVSWIQAVSNEYLCHQALTFDRTRWTYWQEAVAEAARRKFSVDDCRRVLGLPQILIAAKVMNRLDGFDAPGNDIDSEPMRDVEAAECEKSCISNDSCMAATYNLEFRACFLKLQIVIVIADPQAITFYRRELTGTFEKMKLSLLPGVLLRGDVLEQKSSVGYADCQVSCLRNAACRGFSHSNAMKLCSLMATIEEQIANADFASGMK